ncbi:unnamed protein product [Ectocarpus sp. 4 AP-2014]
MLLPLLPLTIPSLVAGISGISSPQIVAIPSTFCACWCCRTIRKVVCNWPGSKFPLMAKIALFAAHAGRPTRQLVIKAFTQLEFVRRGGEDSTFTMFGFSSWFRFYSFSTIPSSMAREKKRVTLMLCVWTFFCSPPADKGRLCAPEGLDVTWTNKCHLTWDGQDLRCHLDNAAEQMHSGRWAAHQIIYARVNGGSTPVMPISGTALNGGIISFCRFMPHIVHGPHSSRGPSRMLDDPRISHPQSSKFVAGEGKVKTSICFLVLAYWNDPRYIDGK